jgi:hypothetical protein
MMYDSSLWEKDVSAEHEFAFAQLSAQSVLAVKEDTKRNENTGKYKKLIEHLVAAKSDYLAACGKHTEVKDLLIAEVQEAAIKASETTVEGAFFDCFIYRKNPKKAV